MMYTGISNSDSLVAYENDQSFIFGPYFWFFLKSLGHSDVKVLDGGFLHWKNNGYPVETGAPTASIQETNFKVAQP